jgi:hypothetical protein
MLGLEGIAVEAQLGEIIVRATTNFGVTVPTMG